MELADKTAAPYAQALFSQRWREAAKRCDRAAAVRVTDGHAERIGGVGARYPRERELAHNHLLHLLLRGAAIAHHGLL